MGHHNFDDTPKTSGLYRIRNLVNGKVYIGQTKNFQMRWKIHLERLQRGLSGLTLLQNSWTKHGEENFVFEILIELEPWALGAAEAAIIAGIPREMRLNVGTGGDAAAQGRVATPEQRVRLSKLRGGKPIFCKNITTGEVRKFEHTGELSAADFDQACVRRCAQGRYGSHRGHTFSYFEDFRQPAPYVKKREVGNSLHRAVVATDLATGEERRFDYIGQVEQHGFAPSAVHGCLKGTCKKHKGYAWRYEDGLPHKSRFRKPNRV